jgi:hypothetical protein
VHATPVAAPAIAAHNMPRLLLDPLDRRKPRMGYLYYGADGSLGAAMQHEHGEPAARSVEYSGMYVRRTARAKEYWCARRDFFFFLQ